MIPGGGCAAGAYRYQALFRATEAAEDLAARAQGFRDREHYWEVLADYVITKRLT